MMTFEFALLDRLRAEALTATRIASEANRGQPTYAHRNGRGVASQLRSLARRGYVDHDDGMPRIYRLTEKGRRYVDA